MEGYMPRIIDNELEFYLDSFGAVLLRGPKWCGKTTTASNIAASTIKMQDPKKSKDYIAAAEADVSLILEGEQPRLIDEWQVSPVIWDAVRSNVDEGGKNGQFILTGSRIPSEDSIQHSGAGRIGVLDMYPMSLYESKDSNGKVSLKALFDGDFQNGVKSDLSVKKIAECLCRGGWPANMGLSYRKCAIRIKSYLDLIYESDDVSLRKYAKDPATAKEIIRSYARNVSSMATMKTMVADVVKNDVSISSDRFADYLAALRGVFLIEDVPAWNPQIRSKDAIRAGPKRELIDPSIAAYYLGITPDNFVDDFNTFGLLFESLCIRDLRVYSSSLSGEVLYYHDKYGLEADAVVRLDDGRYGVIEVKLGSKDIDEGAENLCKLESLLEEHEMKLPSFKMVLTGTELAYQRDDGVYVVPIGCLGP
ncbi:DUF4143 domain-containing protein [Methanomassiliicoccales archaeon LGM-RCC1]|nr:DUF4143 domain-containing protein [Methanomassiliicoccales archaeon LGM-RCC1]